MRLFPALLLGVAIWQCKEATVQSEEKYRRIPANLLFDLNACPQVWKIYPQACVKAFVIVCNLIPPLPSKQDQKRSRGRALGG